MSGGLRVVVVDDEPAVARLHTRFLEAHDGCTVVAVAGTGPEAVEAISTLEPDLVLLDLHLPGFSGLEVLRAIRSGHQRQPEFIAVTAARDFASVRDARLAGVRHYLVKPFSARQLHDRIADIARELAEQQGDVLDQHDIDVLIRSGAQPAALPKGLSVETLDAVRIALSDAPWSSSTEIGERVGVSRVTSRRYLEHLVAQGAAARKMDYATAGRPSTRYGPAEG